MGNTGTIGCSTFGNFETLSLNVLGICVVCCIVYILGYSRRRRAPAYDTEHCLPYSVLVPEQGRLPADRKDLEPRFLDPFALAEMEHEESSSMTSGYLAAKADIDSEGDKDRTKTAEGDSKCTGAEPKTAIAQTETDSTMRSSTSSDDQQAPWRRHSYPQDQERKGILQETSTHHEIEHLPDEVHAEVMWRRRTIVFEGGKP